MLTYLQRLTAERDSLTQAATGLAETAAGEDRDLSETEQTSLRGWSERCAQIDGQLTEYNAQAESTRAYARLRDELAAHDDDDERRPHGRELERRNANPPPRGWGETFVESDAFRNYVGAGSSARVELEGGLGEAVETRAAITTADGIVIPQLYTPRGPTVATPLIDVCGHLPASSNAVSWVQWSPVPPAPAGLVLEGELKPEMNMTAAPMSGTLDTYAHWKEITRQALEDIPQIRTTVETRLRQGIARKVESDIVVALGAATIPPASGTAAQGLLGAIRVGLATVQTNGYTPNAVVLNPLDAAEIDLAILAGTLAGPVVNGSLWGLRIVASPDVPAGTAYVGDFSTAVVVFDRGATTVYLSDSHADNFIRNVLLLLAEIRALVTTPEPQALAECTAGATGTTTARASSSGGK
jgi:HK97 family phage major capsid protein